MRPVSSQVLLVALTLCLCSATATAQETPIVYNLHTYVLTPDGPIPADTARPGQVVKYDLEVTHVGDTVLPPGTVVITGPVPHGTDYMPGSETPTQDGFLLTEFTEDYEEWSELMVADVTAIRWTLLDRFEPGETIVFTFQVRVNGDAQSGGRNWVTYRVRAPQGCTASVTLAGQAGSTQQFSDVPDGWEHSFQGRSGQFLYISAQNQCDHGTVTAIILLDGRVLRQTSSTGAYVIASVNASID